MGLVGPTDACFLPLEGAPFVAELEAGAGGAAEKPGSGGNLLVRDFLGGAAAAAAAFDGAADGLGNCDTTWLETSSLFELEPRRIDDWLPMGEKQQRRSRE